MMSPVEVALWLQEQGGPKRLKENGADVLVQGYCRETITVPARDWALAVVYYQEIAGI
jgi:hypothetical protein